MFADDAMGDEDDEEETDAIVGQVLDELGRKADRPDDRTTDADRKSDGPGRKGGREDARCGRTDQ